MNKTIILSMLLTAVLFISACDSNEEPTSSSEQQTSLVGEYGGVACKDVTKLIFKADGTVRLVGRNGKNIDSTYERQGDQVIVQGDGVKATYTLEGDTLNGGRFLGKCKKAVLSP